MSDEELTYNIGDRLLVIQENEEDGSVIGDYTVLELSPQGYIRLTSTDMLSGWRWYNPEELDIVDVIPPKPPQANTAIEILTDSSGAQPVYDPRASFTVNVKPTLLFNADGEQTDEASGVPL